MDTMTTLRPQHKRRAIMDWRILSWRRDPTTKMTDLAETENSSRSPISITVTL